MGDLGQPVSGFGQSFTDAARDWARDRPPLEPMIDGPVWDDYEAPPKPTGPYKTRFGAISWGDLDKPRAPYEWLVKGVLPAKERTIVYGEPQSGKSFLALDMAMAVARGTPFFGNKVKQAGVVYCAFEGGKGFANRVNAYRYGHEVQDDEVPFVTLTHDADLFGSRESVEMLTAEILHWRQKFHDELNIDLGLIVFDTVSACTPGMDENSGNDMGRFLANGRHIATAADSALMFIHHVPKGGTTPRGSGKLTGDLEAAIHVQFDTRSGVDDEGRTMRIARVSKQREGKAGGEFRFVLKSVRVGQDADGDDVFSCMVLSPGGEPVSGAARGFSLSPSVDEAFGVFWRALKEYGADAPPSLQLPADVRVMRWSQWRDEWAKLDSSADDDPVARAERIKKRMQRAGTALLKWGVIGRSNPWVWWTGKPVRGYKDTFPKKKKVEPAVAPEADPADPLNLIG